MPIAEMGEIAARMLLDTLEGHRPDEAQPVLPVWLHVRESCGATAAPPVAVSGDIDPRR
jgi:DNA-binding LacI/PurR family transcriptional regulator